jgi:phage shock protein A
MNKTLEDVFRELEEKVADASHRMDELKQENGRLEVRIRELERKQAEVVARINKLLDRIAGLR